MSRLFDSLETFADRIALVDEAGQDVTYADLIARAEASVAGLGDTRLLTAIEMDASVEAISAYVGALRAGHAVIALSPGDGRSDTPILQRFAPQAIFSASQKAWISGPGQGAAPVLHPDLAVLLSTSGSTGSAKLVRLSHANLIANARSIIDYLQIGADEAAITTLPLSYSYGLSVIHSHLLAGARLVLFQGSVADPDFGQRLDRAGATSFAGVPHSFELLERVGFKPADHPTLRYFTQAGGRLGPDPVRAWAERARAAGQRFVVMYGQTEAAPRIAYMPPDDVALYPDCIGRAVPGGALRIDPINGGEEGELIYAGPNVMMGYAEDPKDLALGAQVRELRTGDIARRNSAGYFQITGRLNRFSKAFGLRLNLDEVEARLIEAGYAAAVAGDDEGLVIAIAEDAPAAAITALITDRIGVPRAAFILAPLAEIPRLASGKPNYPAILALRPTGAETGPSPSRSSLCEALAETMGLPRVRPEDSFIRLGGDSLNYVRAWLVVEQHLGHCPDGWETMSIAELEGLAPRAPGKMSIDADVLVRSLAIAMVVLHHVTANGVGGGATSLLLVAGINFFRFQTPKLLDGQLRAVLEPLLTKVILPYIVIITAYFALRHGVYWPQYLFYSTFTEAVAEPTGHEGLRTTIFWYLETYVWLIVSASLLVLIKPVSRLLDTRPWTFALSLLLVTMIVGLVAKLNPTLPAFYPHTPFTTAYLFAYGVAIPLAKSLQRKVLMMVLGLGVVLLLANPAGWLGIGFTGLITFAALTLLLFGRKITLGWKLSQTLSAMAGGSLYVYLTQGLVLHPLRNLLGGSIPPLMALPAVLLCFGIGIGVWRLVDWIDPMVGRAFAGLRGGVQAQARA